MDRLRAVRDDLRVGEGVKGSAAPQEPVSARTGPTDIGTAPARAAARHIDLGCEMRTPAKPSQKNGNVDLVLAAVQQGMSDKRAIAIWLRLDVQAVENALKRLIDSGDVRRKMSGGYARARATCLLAEIWR